MGILSVFYAAFGYLALLLAILWGMLFLGDSVVFPNMDAAGSAAPLQAALVDLGLLLCLALLHRLVSRGMLRHFVRPSIPPRLERSTQAWAAAAGLALIYAGWQPLPEVLWNAGGTLQWALSALFYLAWTLIMIGAFLACHLDLFEVAQARVGAPLPTDTLRQPLYCGILVAVWATRVMTVGHLLLAAAITAYLVFDALWAAHDASDARQSHAALLFEGKRLAR
jgi:methanethiol S-methyltransferase